MKKIWKVLLIVVALLVISFTIASACPPEPRGEQCGRCSNVFDGWVEWYDRDGGCDNDFWNERVEYPGDERCVVPPTETPVLGCAFTMYVLQGNGTCSLTRNYGLEDTPGKIPSRFAQDGKLTAYGQGLCNKCRTTPFKYSGEWTTTCDIPCVDCN